MSRPLRLSFENAVYHITARGNRKENIFYEEEDKELFLDRMNKTFKKYGFVCYAYTLMDNHYHLFVKTLYANITEGMHYLNASYTNWFKAKCNIVGVIFQGRYKSILVDEDSHSLVLSAYIHLNPVRAKIVDNPKKFKWSSYLDYLGKRNSVERLDADFILKQFDQKPKKAVKKYESFVAENFNMNSPLENSYRGIALGRESFIEKIKSKLESVGNKREIVETKIVGRSTKEKIIEVMMNKFSLAREQILLKRRGNIYRPLAMYLIKGNTGLSLREIGALFDMDYAAVSQACRRFEEKIRTDKSVREISEAVEGVLQECNVKC